MILDSLRSRGTLPLNSAHPSLAEFLRTREKTLYESLHVAWVQFRNQA